MEFFTGYDESPGFPHDFCNRIEVCITTVTYIVLINGSSTGFIQPMRGLRQRDPMSHFLFLICAKGLSAMLRSREERGSLHGMQVMAGGIQMLRRGLWSSNQ